MGTEIIWTKSFEKQLRKVPNYVQVKAQYWIRMVETFGILEIRKQPGFHDEPLLGKRQGERSVRLSRSYRLIYEELEKHIKIRILEVNNHDY